MLDFARHVVNQYVPLAARKSPLEQTWPGGQVANQPAAWGYCTRSLSTVMPVPR
jgi:hypothetical protein